jgi:hypothetical protein
MTLPYNIDSAVGIAWHLVINGTNSDGAPLDPTRQTIRGMNIEWEQRQESCIDYTDKALPRQASTEQAYRQVPALGSSPP